MAERARSSKSKGKTASKKKPPKGGQASRGKVAKAGIGHNSGAPSEALIKGHHEKLDAIETRMAAAKTKYDQIKGEHRSAYAVVKQDGIVVDDFKLARELDKRDHGSVVTGYANVGVYLRAIKSDLAIQMDLFAEISPPPAANATLAGTQAFANKEPRDNNPHKAGSEEFANWDAAWMAGAGGAEMTDGDGKPLH